MTEYLKDFVKEKSIDPGWEKILETGRPIGKNALTNYLTSAHLFLTTEPGPNLGRRRELSSDWLPWWAGFINSTDYDTRPALLMPLNHIRRYSDPDVETGVLFAGGLEGHRGHRFAVDWMHAYVKPILLFEQDEYLIEKDREKPFLPLNVRLSMWSYYSPDMMISVIPKRNPEITENTHYENIFSITGADYCFATEGDPNEREKRIRGKWAHFTQIPNVDTPSTTIRVEKLFPG